MTVVLTQPLTAGAFAPFGDVLEAAGDPTMQINQDMCERFHDRAKLDFGNGRAGISIFRSKTRSLPYQLDMVERHPMGSQAFIPMSQHPFLIIVASDKAGVPTNPLAFISDKGQAINLHKGTWHGVLTPLNKPGVFAVIDRIGEGNNLEEYYFDTPYQIEIG